MNRIPPSEKIRKQIETLLNGDWVTTEEFVSKFVLLGTQLLVQESSGVDPMMWAPLDLWKRVRNAKNASTIPAGVSATDR